ncbi:uncharacterized protein LOC6575220 [Drosophila mojavensis]|uniref:Uncharacterized protein n=1 Tax=Drosophila mojavensis TaxID=7230 RepID=B4KA20_DROMO|nr:uncharacterized protein LOC6575220 [Drosophila mojavensis]EDW16695.1 uncharacterized protein Dmoj_GI10675 [Drosophila mojavensis]
MLRHKRNNNNNNVTKTTHSEHVKRSGPADALHPHLNRSTPAQRQLFNQHLNQRVTLSLELYHKNIIKELIELNKINVYKLTKNVSQT